MYGPEDMLLHGRFGIAITIYQWKTVASNVEKINGFLKKLKPQRMPLRFTKAGTNAILEELRVAKKEVNETIKEEDISSESDEGSDESQASTEFDEASTDSDEYEHPEVEQRINYNLSQKFSTEFPYITVLIFILI